MYNALCTTISIQKLFRHSTNIPPLTSINSFALQARLTLARGSQTYLYAVDPAGLHFFTLYWKCIFTVAICFATILSYIGTLRG